MVSVRFSLVVIGILLGGLAHGQTSASTQSMDKCPMMGHETQMTQRGDQAMGFSAAKTTHHFRLYVDGGAIEVLANDSVDTQSRDQIRMHLSHIAEMFAQGHFDVPMLIHDTTPPGVPTMARLQKEIQYRYEEIPSGGRVRIVAGGSQALDAVHAFLLFQIIEHKTGDAAAIESQSSK